MLYEEATTLEEPVQSGSIVDSYSNKLGDLGIKPKGRIKPPFQTAASANEMQELNKIASNSVALGYQVGSKRVSYN